MADSGDDFGDFTGFSTDFQANSNSSRTSHQASNDLKSNKWTTASNKESTFASFPPPQDQNISGNGTSTQTNFDFSAASNTTSGGFANFSQFDLGGISMADIDIPLPSSPPGADIHVAGGVPFDIPPLPDSCSFDEEFPPLTLPTEEDSPVELVGKGLGIHSFSESVPITQDSTTSTHPLSGNNVSDITAQGVTVEKYQPVECFGDFTSSNSGSDVTTQVPFQDSIQKEDNGLKQNSNSSGDVILPTVDEFPNEIEGNNWNADFESFETHSPINVKGVSKDEELANADSLPDTNTPFDTSKVTDSDIGGFAEFSAFESGDGKRGKDDEPSSSSTNGDIPQTENSSNFANFAAFSSKPDTDNVSTESGGTTLQHDTVHFDFEGSAAIDSKQNTVLVNADDFGEFGVFPDVQPPSQVVPSIQPDTNTDSSVTFSDTLKDSNSPNVSEEGFGDFAGGGTGFQGDTFGSKAGVSDDFGDFTSGNKFEFGATFEDNSGFGDFSTSNIQTLTPAAGIGRQEVQEMGKVLVTCFPVSDQLSQDVSSNSKQLQTLLLSTKSREALEQSAWESLQKSIDFTIPLYKWDKSNLQDHYYNALKIDPLLISRPTTLAILTGMTKFEDPLGGTTAAEDLMESFGFEVELEQSTRRSTSPTDRQGRQRSEERYATPTLLDLSLPETPKSPTKKSFTLAADLLGLDLNPQPPSQQLTSIQELLRNERLVVNKSKWVDSKLVEFGGQQDEDESNGSQPPTPRSAKRQNTVEFQLLQLGLDANKVSSFSSGNKELSLGARSVLGRLPDLSFMLTTDTLVQSAKYSA